MPRAPVGAIVVKHLADRLAIATVTSAHAPGRIVFHAIRRIGHHQMRLGAGEHALHVLRIGGVAAGQAMAAEQPDVAANRRRGRLDFRRLVGISKAGWRNVQQAGDATRLKAELRNIDAEAIELDHFELQQFFIVA